MFVLWNLATLIGAFGARAIDDPATYGLDAAASAAFVALLAPRMTSRGDVGRGDRGDGRRAGAHAVGSRGRAGAVRRARRGGRGLEGAGADVDGGARRFGRLLRAEARRPVGATASGSDHPRVQRIAELLPIALLSALIGTQTFADGRHLAIDARAAGLVVAMLLVWRRAPFLVVVFGAAATAALLRLAT